MPLSLLRRLCTDAPQGTRTTLIGLGVVLLIANLATWALAVAVFRHYPLLLGTAFLAYSFGLRHAVDADHIAAIDNVTRKLVQDGRRPLAVGFFFSLGHATVVVALSVVIALTAASIRSHFPAWRDLGATVGTLVSALFLLLIAGVNLVSLRSGWQAFRFVHRGGGSAAGAHAHGHGHPHAGHGAEFDAAVQGGLLSRLCRPLVRLIGASWHMYPLGVLFGLGFDTATEVGVLGISASQAASGLSVWAILIFPLLFTAGMALIDTADGVLMLGAYGWACVAPVRKLYYNLVITGVSVAVALAVGALEVLGLVADRWHLEGWWWSAIGSLNDHFGVIGYAIITLFALVWLLSALIYRLKGFDKLERPLG